MEAGMADTLLQVSSMNVMRSLRILALALCCFSSRAADDRFYGDFLRFADTNDMNPRGLSSPLLVDTNNATPKIGKSVLQLDKLKAGGQIGDICLGMTMGEVVGRWGKPMRLYSHCGGGPRLVFSDASLYFRGNALKRISLPDTAILDKGLLAQSSLTNWVRVLGEPSKRTDDQYGLYIRYETARAVICLCFDPDGTMKFPPWVELPATTAEPKK
jgi:hypothetical protein